MRRNAKVKPVERTFVIKNYSAEQVLIKAKEAAAYEKKYAKADLDKWSIRFQENPASALEWANPIFAQAARFELASWVEAELNNIGDKPSDVVLNGMRNHLATETMRKAKWPEQSTSPTSNLVSLCINAQRAEWVEKFDRLIELIGQEYKEYHDDSTLQTR